MAFRNEPWIKETLDKISKLKGLDRRVVALVIAHPYAFTAKVARDPEDSRPVMHRYFGKFAIRGGKQKKK